MTNQGQALARLEPDQMKEYLLSQPLSKGGRLWCDRVLEGVDKRDRTCMRLFGEAMKWVGAQVNIGQVFLQQMNVSSEKELATLVDQGRKLERLTNDAGMSDESYRDEALGLLKELLERYPEWREGMIQSLAAK